MNKILYLTWYCTVVLGFNTFYAVICKTRKPK